MSDPGIKILFVEDDPTMKALFSIIMRERASSLLYASNGHEGLEIFAAHHPDLIITDIQMPVMTGLEMIRKIRNINPEAKCVILSAYSVAEYFLEAIEMGVQGFLTKPLDRKKLLLLVEEIESGILLERRMHEQERMRKEAEDSLRKLNEELETRVANRTFDLKNEITEREKAQSELLEMNKHLERLVQEELRKREQQQQILIQKSKLESLGELAAGMAHELNQPLSGISMGLDNIIFQLEQQKMTEDYLRSKVGNMFQDIERIKHIINHVRTFSRDQRNDDLEIFDACQTARNALSMVATQYRNHHIELKTDICNMPQRVRGNPYKLEQVLLNLLSNAKHAVDQKFEKQNNKEFRKEIMLTCFEEFNKVILGVTDNGTGMPKAIQDRIFEPFFTTKSSGLGTGLGLSIVYGIVKEMGGEIRVRSKEGCFTGISIVLQQVNDEELEK